MAKKVPKEHYSLNDVREILGDESLPSRNLRGGSLHKSESINGRFIDPEYCPGTTDEERALALKQDIDGDGEMHGRYWRNYGPKDGDIGVEIHFANMVDRENIEHIDNGRDYDGKYILHYSYPPSDNLNAYATTNYDFGNRFGSIPGSYFNENIPDDFGSHKLALKVGFNSNNVDTENVKFGIKVTTYLGSEYDVDSVFEYEVGGSAYQVTPWSTVAGVSGGIAATGSTYASGILDKFTGNMEQYFYKIQNKINYYSGLGDALAAVGNIATGIGAFMAMIQVGDMILNLVEDSKQLKEGTYHYKNLTQGLYNREDVKDSLAKIGVGLKHNNIVKEYGSYRTYEPFESDDLNMEIEGDRTKHYINLDFHPKGVQYDLSVPPPMVYYKIELIPISGCKLSTTKPTIIGVSMMPFKYERPKFDIEPYGDWHHGSIGKFINAKYCDYIALRDLDRSGSFNRYQHLYIGTWGNEEPGRDKYPRDINSSILPLPITDIFTLGNVLNNPSLSGTIFYHGAYEVIFAKDKFPQLVMNWEFINRQGAGDPDLNMAPQYWVLGDGWDITSGALYKNGGPESICYQEVDRIQSGDNHKRRRIMYLMDIDIVVNSGEFYIDCANTFYAYMYDRVIQDYYGGDKIPEDQLPDGIRYDGPNNRIIITKTMRFFYILKSRVDESIDSRIKLGAIANSQGFIKHCKCKRMSDQEGLSSDRIRPLANFPINVDLTPKENSIHFWIESSGEYHRSLFPIHSVIPIRPYDTSIEHKVVLSTDDDSPDKEYSIVQDYYGDWKLDRMIVHDATRAGIIKITLKAYGIASFTRMGTLFNSSIIDIEDEGDLMYEGEFIITGGNITGGVLGKEYKIGQGAEGFITKRCNILQVFTKLKQLTVVNQPFVTDDLATLTTQITKQVDLSKTNIHGDIGFLQDVNDTIILEDTKVLEYSGVRSINQPSVIWRNQGLLDELGNPIIIPTNVLERLVGDLYNGTKYNKELRIDLDNAPIVDFQTLDYIEEMIQDRNWMIDYNMASLPLMIINGDQPLTITAEFKDKAIVMRDGDNKDAIFVSDETDYPIVVEIPLYPYEDSDLHEISMVNPTVLGSFTVHDTNPDIVFSAGIDTLYLDLEAYNSLTTIMMGDIKYLKHIEINPNTTGSLIHFSINFYPYGIPSPKLDLPMVELEKLVNHMSQQAEGALFIGRLLEPFTDTILNTFDSLLARPDYAWAVELTLDYTSVITVQNTNGCNIVINPTGAKWMFAVIGDSPMNAPFRLPNNSSYSVALTSNNKFSILYSNASKVEEITTISLTSDNGDALDITFDVDLPNLNYINIEGVDLENLGLANINDNMIIDLSDNTDLSIEAIGSIIIHIDNSGAINGQLDISNTSPVAPEYETALNSIINKGWTVSKDNLNTGILFNSTSMVGGQYVATVDINYSGITGYIKSDSQSFKLPYTGTINGNGDQFEIVVDDLNAILELELTSPANNLIIGDNVTKLQRLVASGIGLTNGEAPLNAPDLLYIDLSDNGIAKANIDLLLQIADSYGSSNGILKLTGNDVPSIGSDVYINNLLSRNWTVEVDEAYLEFDNYKVVNKAYTSFNISVIESLELSNIDITVSNYIGNLVSINYNHNPIDIRFSHIELSFDQNQPNPIHVKISGLLENIISFSNGSCNNINPDGFTFLSGLERISLYYDNDNGIFIDNSAIHLDEVNNPNLKYIHVSSVGDVPGDCSVFLNFPNNDLGYVNIDINDSDYFDNFTLKANSIISTAYNDINSGKLAIRSNLNYNTIYDIQITSVDELNLSYMVFDTNTININQINKSIYLSYASVPNNLNNNSQSCESISLNYLKSNWGPLNPNNYVNASYIKTDAALDNSITTASAYTIDSHPNLNTLFYKFDRNVVNSININNNNNLERIGYINVYGEDDFDVNINNNPILEYLYFGSNSYILPNRVNITNNPKLAYISISNSMGYITSIKKLFNIILDNYNNNTITKGIVYYEPSNFNHMFTEADRSLIVQMYGITGGDPRYNIDYLEKTFRTNNLVTINGKEWTTYNYTGGTHDGVGCIGNDISVKNSGVDAIDMDSIGKLYSYDYMINNLPAGYRLPTLDELKEVFEDKANITPTYSRYIGYNTSGLNIGKCISGSWYSVQPGYGYYLTQTFNEAQSRIIIIRQGTTEASDPTSRYITNEVSTDYASCLVRLIKI